jgi:hypothetical protein
MISNTHKFIFVHIPKNAGTSIENLLFKHYHEDKKKHIFFDKKLLHFNQHLTLSEIQKHRVRGQSFFDYFKFTYVRNPWERMVSAAKYRRMTLKQFIYSDFSSSQQSSNLDPDRHRLPQYDFLFDDSGNKLIDFIGRYETLQEDFDIICDKLKIPRQTLPHKNISKHKHYTECYDDETYEIVAEKHAKDIECFGYEFGE